VPDLSKAQRLAIAAVARHFHTHWQVGDGPPDAYAAAGRRRIALDVAVIGRQSSGKRPSAKARLREDRVARSVLRDLEAALHPHVPNHKSIILTLGAPIKVPTKLIAALTNLLLDYLQRAIEERDERKTVLGNRVRFRVLSHGPSWNAKLIGFVFSGDPAPGAIANSMRSFHAVIAAKAKGRMPKGFAGDRWLVLSSENWIADIKTYRLAFSRLSAPRNNFKKILMHFDGGRIEPLAKI
jgi:hypothetical protein